MVLSIDNKIEIKIQEGGEIKETLEVSYRYPTKKEEKELDNELEKIKKLVSELRKIGSKIESLEKRIEYAEKQGNFEKAEQLLDKKEKLETRLEKMQEEVESMGGADWAEAINKKTFEMLVSGEGKERLREYAEAMGYTKIMAELNKARAELEGKQS
jgi:ABC-type Fe3+-citrate transport system substrate-binding protein